MNISNLTTGQLQQILAIKEQIEALQSQLDSIAGGGDIPTPSTQIHKKRRMSVAGRRAIAAGAKARWAKIKGTGATSEPVKVKRKISAAHKRKLIKALAKARKIRLAGLKAQKAAPKAAKTAIKILSEDHKAKLAAAAKARWAKAKAEGKKTL